jgi:hypothetical protein
LQTRKKFVDFRPNHLAAGQASPMHADQPNQLEADIDWGEVIFAFCLYPIYQERLDIRFHLRQDRIARYQ